VPETFDSIRAKLDWGKERADALKAEMVRELEKWGDPETRIEINPEGTPVPPDLVAHLVARGVATQPGFRTASYFLDFHTFRPEDGIALGEILHQYRGALDHPAWRLVKNGLSPSLKATAARQVQFPFAKTRDSYWKDRRRLPGVPKAIRAFIEEYQPYRRSGIGRTMRALRDFSDADKHRSVMPVVSGVFEFNLEAKARNCERVGIRWYVDAHRHFKSGAKLCDLAVIGFDPAHSAVGMEGDFSLIPMLPRNFPFELFLNQVHSLCTEIVGGCEERLAQTRLPGAHG
jgi:hypothetical protein